MEVPHIAWYLAWHPDGSRDGTGAPHDPPEGVIRLKTPPRLREWRGRDWWLFPGPPLIVDVTLQMLEVMDAVAADERLGRPSNLLAVVLDAEGIALRIRPRDGDRLPEEVAVVDFARAEWWLDPHTLQDKMAVRWAPSREWHRSPEGQTWHEEQRRITEDRLDRERRAREEWLASEEGRAWERRQLEEARASKTRPR